MADIALPTVAIPKAAMVSESDDEQDRQPQKRVKYTVLPCDDEKKASWAEGGKFRWAACECIVFEWAVNDPTQLANTERGNLFRDVCKSKEELL